MMSLGYFLTEEVVVELIHLVVVALLQQVEPVVVEMEGIILVLFGPQAVMEPMD